MLPLQRMNLKNAIATSTNGKSPGSDGYPAEYYKILLPDVVPTFTNLLNAVYLNNVGVD